MTNYKIYKFKQNDILSIMCFLSFFLEDFYFVLTKTKSNQRFNNRIEASESIALIILMTFAFVYFHRTQNHISTTFAC